MGRKQNESLSEKSREPREPEHEEERPGSAGPVLCSVGTLECGPGLPPRAALPELTQAASWARQGSSLAISKAGWQAVGRGCGCVSQESASVPLILKESALTPRGLKAWPAEPSEKARCLMSLEKGSQLPQRDIFTGQEITTKKQQN